MFADELTQVGFASRIVMPVYRPRTFISTGDGGFMFVVAELATSVQHGIHLVTVQFNNHRYGNVQQMQRNLHGGRMKDSRIVLPPDSPAHRLLSAAARNARAVFFAGLPGVGKTLMLQQMALLSHAAGRSLHLLQWDVARQSFETPEILERYPEVDGATHAAIRKAAGLWVRRAVAAWAAAHRTDGALLLGEAPLVGNRLSELAHPDADAAEAFLAAADTLFIVPAPTLDVRRVIESARAREIAQPRHARESANAPPQVVELLMEELRDAGSALAVPGAHAARGYDPEVYVAIYSRVLAHRHVHPLSIEQCWPVSGSAYRLDCTVTELQPSRAEVDAVMARVDALGAVETEHAVTQWYRPG